MFCLIEFHNSWVCCLALFIVGVGTLTWPDGVVYEGDFFAGNLSGKGTYRWPDGSIYSGGILNGKREGDGKFESSGGQVYEGQWKDGIFPVSINMTIYFLIM